MAGSRAARLAAFGFLALASLLAAGAARQADAGGAASRAVVIVGSTPVCITFNGTINGVDALHRAGVQATTAGFGGLGSGVCAIEGQGCPASACFQCALPDYWHYFRANSGGAFSSSPVGASSTQVGDGDIEAWVWGSTVGPPAPVHVNDVCDPAPPTSAPTAPPVSALPPTANPGSSATPSPAPGQSSGPAASGVSGAQGLAPTTSGPPTTEAAESTGAGRTTITAPDPAPAGEPDTDTDDDPDLTAALASDANLASAPSIAGGAESSVAAWRSVAIGVVLVAGVVGWALWRRRTRVG